MKLTINNKVHTVNVEPEMPLLYFLRDELKLTGTKFGCGAGQCGACTIHLDGKATRACITPVSVAENKHITTIEGLSDEGDHKVQLAWKEYKVPQCGYCQSGQMMSASALLAENPQPSAQEIDAHMQGNICRCGTYKRIKQAINAAAKA